MAKQLKSKSNVDYPKDGYPFGSIRDRITGVQSGTPVNTDVYSDTHQFFNKLMDVSNKKPNGFNDSGENGFQLIHALASFMVKVLKPSIFEAFDSSSPEAAFDIDWKGACYGGGYFYRAGSSSITNIGYISRSVDGINWEMIFDSGLDSIELTGIAYGENGTLMVSTIVIGAVLFSNDYGENWIPKNIPGAFLSEKIKIQHIGGSSWSFLGYKNTGDFMVYKTDDDGDTSTIFNLDAFPSINLELVDYVYDHGLHVLIGQVGTDPRIYNSTDLVTWNLTISGGNGDNISVCSYTANDSYFDYSASSTYEAQKGFLVLQDDSVDGSIIIVLSSDGSISSAVDLVDEDYKKIIYGNGKVVVVAEGATDNKNIVQSFDLFKNIEYVPNILSGFTGLIDIVYGDGKFILCRNDARTPIMQ